LDSAAHICLHRAERREAPRCRGGGQGGIRTPEGVSQQIYSLPPLAAWVPARVEAQGLRLQASATAPLPETWDLQWSWRSDLHRQPPVYKTGALLLSYASLCRAVACQPRAILGTRLRTVKRNREQRRRI